MTGLKPGLTKLRASATLRRIPASSARRRPTQHARISCGGDMSATPRLWLPLFVSIATACASQPPLTPSRPHLLLVTVDTLRADRIGNGVTPTIDSVAANGLRFINARTVAPLTLPAHTSILTGLRPPEHGVRLNGVGASSHKPTVADRLRQHGYNTAAVVGAFVLDRRFGLGEGFDSYDDAIKRDPDGDRSAGSGASCQRRGRSRNFMAGVR